MSETKSFHIGTILTVTSGRMVSPDHIGGVYDLLGWMVDEPLMTHQLPRVSDECSPLLCETFPDLAAIDVEAAHITNEAEMLTWLASLEAEYGTRRDVPRADRVAGEEMRLRTERLNRVIQGFSKSVRDFPDGGS